MKKYVLYLNVEEKLELKGRTITTTNHITSFDQFYEDMMRSKVTRELLGPEDKLLILTTKGETHITKLE